MGVGRRDPGLQQRFVGRLRPVDLGPLVDRERLAVGPANAVDDAHPPGRRRVEVAALARRPAERRERLRATRRGPGRPRRGPAPSRPSRSSSGTTAIASTTWRVAPRSTSVPPWSDMKRASDAGSRASTNEVSAASSRPSRSNHSAARWWRSRISDALSGRRDSVYSRIRPWSAYQPGSPGSGWRKRARFDSSSSVAAGSGTPTASSSGAENRSKWTAWRIERARLLGGARHDLLGEVREDRPLGALEPVQHALPVAAGRDPVGLDREPDGRGPATRRGLDPRRGDVAKRSLVVAVRPEQRIEQGPDLLDGEREGRPAEVDDLALAAKPLDRERHLGSRRDDDVEVRRRDADQGLDEPQRAGRTGEDVEVVEDEREVARERDLERIGHECRGGRRLGHDRRVVRRLDRAGDGVREVLRDRRQLQPERRGDAGRERAHVPVGGVERVPGRRADRRDPRRQRRLPEARPARDDRQAAFRAVEQVLLEDRPRQRPDRVGRRQQLGGSTARGARDVIAACGGVPRVDLVAALRDGVRIGGHRVPCEQGPMVNGGSRFEPWHPNPRPRRCFAIA